jgi:hypothetical protein
VTEFVFVVREVIGEGGKNDKWHKAGQKDFSVKLLRGPETKKAE